MACAHCGGALYHCLMIAALVCRSCGRTALWLDLGEAGPVDGFATEHQYNTVNRRGYLLGAKPLGEVDGG